MPEETLKYFTDCALKADQEALDEYFFNLELFREPILTTQHGNEIIEAFNSALAGAIRETRRLQK